jgi:hypothetical protein
VPCVAGVAAPSAATRGPHDDGARRMQHICILHCLCISRRACWKNWPNSANCAWMQFGCASGLGLLKVATAPRSQSARGGETGFFRFHRDIPSTC